MASSTLAFMVILAVDFISFGLALVAEQMRSSARVVVDSDFDYAYCVYEPNVATSLGIAASVLLLVSYLYSPLTGRGVYVGKDHKKLECYGTCSVILSVVTWVTFLMAEACLAYGSIKSAQQNKYRTIFGVSSPDCQTLQEGVFEVGAALIMITTMVSKFSYIRGCSSVQGYEMDNYELGSYTSLG